MRTMVFALALVGLAVTLGQADDVKPAKIAKPKTPAKQKEKSEATLKVGDAAPDLKATKWLRGGEVKSFEAGKVYVVEFWATWCGPCIVMMPHLGDLQEEYRSKGVTVIGYSAADPNNSEKKVEEFVEKRGAQLGYTFAFADNRDSYNAWMKAAGQNGIPCSFVVDKAGKIAYIGHPMYLDVVLPKVVAGEWKGKEGAEEMAKVEEDVNEVFKAINGKDGLEKLAAFEKKHPQLANIPYFLMPKLSGMVKAGKTNEVSKLANEVMEKAGKRGDTMALRSVSAALRSDKTKADLMALSLKAANAMVKAAGEKDMMAQYNLAETHLAAGDKAKAKDALQKAVDAASGPNKDFLEKRLKALDEKKEDKEKE